jgi:hypothetical protein
MKQLITICILIILTTSCENKNKNVVEDFSVNVELIETGDIGSCNCLKHDDYFYNRVAKIMVKNNTTSSKSFWIMRCSWQESFRSNTEDVSLLPRDCNSNFPIEIKLPPFQTITFNTILRHKQFSKTKSFKIGLIMLEEKDFLNPNKKFNAKYKESKRTYWSDPVSLDLETFGYKWKE